MLAAGIKRDYNDTATVLLPPLSTNQTDTITHNKEHPVSHLASIRLVTASQVPVRDTRRRRKEGRGKAKGGNSKNTRV